MRSYLKVITLLREFLEAQEDVKTIIHLVRSEGDLYKKNIYPLACINPTSATLDNGNVIQFSFDIAVMNVRDLSTDEIQDKFIGNDNQVFNLNMCHAVLNSLVTYLRLMDNEDGIELVGATNLTPLILTNQGLLDGWVLGITLEVPNIDVDACS